MPFVLDASVTMAWCFADEGTTFTEAVLDRLRVEGAVVPAVWSLEVTNTLVLGERRQRASPAEIVAFARLLQTLPIEIEAASELSTALGPVHALAREHGLSSYDASYVELALRRGLPVATLDARMLTAAARLGVPVIEETIDGTESASGARDPATG